MHFYSRIHAHRTHKQITYHTEIDVRTLQSTIAVFQLPAKQRQTENKKKSTHKKTHLTKAKNPIVPK